MYNGCNASTCMVWSPAKPQLVGHIPQYGNDVAALTTPVDRCHMSKFHIAGWFCGLTSCNLRPANLGLLSSCGHIQFMWVPPLLHETVHGWVQENHSSKGWGNCTSQIHVFIVTYFVNESDLIWCYCFYLANLGSLNSHGLIWFMLLPPTCTLERV